MGRGNVGPPALSLGTPSSRQPRSAPSTPAAGERSGGDVSLLLPALLQHMRHDQELAAAALSASCGDGTSAASIVITNTRILLGMLKPAGS